MMILQHSAMPSWLVDGPLSTSGAKRLRARHAGRLAVCAGRVWVTRAGDLDDHVLEAGQALRVGADDDVVVEPWQGGTARLVWRSDQPRVLLARLAALVATLARRLSAPLRGARGEAALAMSAAASDSRAQGAMAAGESSASSGADQ